MNIKFESTQEYAYCAGENKNDSTLHNFFYPLFTLRCEDFTLFPSTPSFFRTSRRPALCCRGGTFHDFSSHGAASLHGFTIHGVSYHGAALFHGAAIHGPVSLHGATIHGVSSHGATTKGGGKEKAIMLSGDQFSTTFLFPLSLFSLLFIFFFLIFPSLSPAPPSLHFFLSLSNYPVCWDEGRSRRKCFRRNCSHIFTHSLMFLPHSRLTIAECALVHMLSMYAYVNVSQTFPFRRINKAFTMTTRAANGIVLKNSLESFHMTINCYFLYMSKWA